MNNQEHESRPGWGLGEVSSRISPQVNAHMKDGRLVLPKDLHRNLAGVMRYKIRHTASWRQKCHSMSSPLLMTKNVPSETQGMAHVCLSSFGNRTLYEEWQNCLKVQGPVHALGMQVIPATKPSWNVHLCSDKTTTYLERQVALHPATPWHEFDLCSFLGVLKNPNYCKNKHTYT